MEDFSQELKVIKIFLKEDIARLRQYINKKFPYYDTKRQAQILIDSLRRILDKHMVGLPQQHQKSIREKLLKEVLLSKADGLFMYDIYEASAALEVDEGFSTELCQWVNRYISSPIEATPKIELAIPANLAAEGVPSSLTVIDAAPEKPLRILVEEKKIRILLMAALILFSSAGIYTTQLNRQPPQEIVIEEPVAYIYTHLPPHFYYKEIDTEKLKAYLNTRNSLLAQEPYFSAILETSREFQLNPLILFAIAGHEQGFVPMEHPSAYEIANNPFNVFNSWQSYNTDITDSSGIAARTIINLLLDRPEEMNPFQWINRKYAEDENWWRGINSIYNRLEKEVSIQNLAE